MEFNAFTSKKVPRGTLLLIVLLSFHCIMSSAQVTQSEDFKVKLKSRVILPASGIENAFRLDLQKMITSDEKFPMVYIQFKDVPSKYDRLVMQEEGIRLLAYIGNNTWFSEISNAEVLDFQNPEVQLKVPQLKQIRWIGKILREDKLSSDIQTGQFGDHAITSDGKVKLVVKYFDGTDPEMVASRLQQTGCEMIGNFPRIRTSVIAVDASNINRLADEEFVRWIEMPSPMGQPEQNRIREHLNVNALQENPYNLDGDGVTVGVFENSHAYINHPDLSGRAYKGDNDPTNYFYHSTNMAGIIAGDGHENINYRGMATEATIYTYDFEPGTASGTHADNHANFLGDLQEAVANDGIDLANNSWGTFGCQDHGFEYGIYEGLCPTLDEVVRGYFGKPVTIVFSAGNERDGFWDGTDENRDCITDVDYPYANYFTMNHPKAAKNIIAVGAIDSENDRMTTYSSWGPTADGRLKPEIVASGHVGGVLHAGVTEATTAADHLYLAPYYPVTTANYGYIYMTSAAAAATTGCIALLLDQYRQEFQTGMDPLPSTLKALLLHTAEDLNDGTNTWYNPGPDYASGYGLLNIRAAVDHVDAGNLREGKISNGRSDFFNLIVPTGASEVKATLVWDDFPAVDNAADALVNDLDIVLYDPNNVAYYPWLLDPDNPQNAAGTGADHVNNVEQVMVNGAITPGTWRIEISAFALPESPQRYSIVTDFPMQGDIDVIQVLDRSGSMGGYASMGMTDTKIEKLRTAASQFVNIMAPDIGNRLGLVLFNHDVVPFGADDDAALSHLTSSRALDLVNNTITEQKIPHGGATSIGDGLREALNQFTSVIPDMPEHDRSILLVTDGKENSYEWISTVQPDLIANDVTVYALGLGYGSGINESTLVNLANATGGDYRITADHLVFQKLFIEALAGAADWSVINDPVGYIGKGEVMEIPVSIQPDQMLVSMTTYWDGMEDAIEMELVAPNGTVITSGDNNSEVRIGKQPGYIFYQLDFPLSGSLEQQWAGEWKIRLTGKSIIDPKYPVRYATSAFASSGPQLDVSFNKFLNHTGENIRLNARLSRNATPVTGAKITVYGDIPAVGVGNVLHYGKVNYDLLHQLVISNGDTMHIIDRKLQLLAEEQGQPLLQRESTQLVLYDDGLHGDGSANDGLYSNEFSNTTVQGSYTFRFVASEIPGPGNLKSNCEWTKSFYNEVNIAPGNSVIKYDQVGASSQGTVNNIKVAPTDRLGNYMGPGHKVKARTYTMGTTRDTPLEDHIDGTYSAEILLTKEELVSGISTEILIDDKIFTTVKSPFRKWSISLHGGTSAPLGTLANDYQSGMLIMLDASYHLSPWWSVILLGGYNGFTGNTPVPDNYWLNTSANIRYNYLFNAPWTVYIGAGPGIYKPETGTSGFGINGGIGVEYSVNGTLDIELGTNYNRLLSQDVHFVQNHLGIVIKF